MNCCESKVPTSTPATTSASENVVAAMRTVASANLIVGVAPCRQHLRFATIFGLVAFLVCCTNASIVVLQDHCCPGCSCLCTVVNALLPIGLLAVEEVRNTTVAAAPCKHCAGTTTSSVPT